MSKEFKKMFFMCLLSVLLIVSNLIGIKYTNFLDITIGVDFVTFPFTYLCTLLILNYGNKRDAYRGIVIACVIQSLITISYTIAITLSSQTLMPDSALYVNQVFKVNEINILASLLAFGLSHCLLIYIYDAFTRCNRELYGIVLGLLGSFFLNIIIYIGICMRMYEPIYIANMMLSNVLIDTVMIIIIVVIFYILKETNEINVVYHNKDIDSHDVSTDELLESKKSTKTVKKQSTNKETKQKSKRNYSKNNSKVGSNKNYNKKNQAKKTNGVNK